jgi:hypothetical protein
MLGAPVLKRGRGPQSSPPKVLTSLRLDADILEFFKSKDAGYQLRINAALRAEVERNLRGLLHLIIHEQDKRYNSYLWPRKRH